MLPQTCRTLVRHGRHAVRFLSHETTGRHSGTDSRGQWLRKKAVFKKMVDDLEIRVQKLERQASSKLSKPYKFMMVGGAGGLSFFTLLNCVELWSEELPSAYK